MTYRDLKIGDIVHMTYNDGDEIYTLYSYVTDIQTNEITFSDLYCDKGPSFIDSYYKAPFPSSDFTLIAVVSHHPTVNAHFKSLFLNSPYKGLLCASPSTLSLLSSTYNSLVTSNT